MQKSVVFPKEVFCSVSHVIVLWFLRERDGPECLCVEL